MFLAQIGALQTLVKPTSHIWYATTIPADSTAFSCKTTNPLINSSKTTTSKTYLSNSKIKAARTNNTQNDTRAIKKCPSTAPPIILAKIPKPSAPAANCLPTSPRPVDVSLVAITTDVLKRATAAAVKRSPNDLKFKKVKGGVLVLWNAATDLMMR